MNLERILNQLDGVKQIRPNQWQTCCPCHDDTDPSLTLTQNPDKLLWTCHAGCSQEDVQRELQRLSGEDETPRPKRTKKPQQARPKAAVVEEYVYVDASGQPVMKVTRTEDKGFYQSRWDGHQYRPGLNGIEAPLYHADEIADPGRVDEPVFLPEGEKDVDHLRDLGVLATTNAGGCNAWRSELAGDLQGREVAIFYDDDEPGRKLAEQKRQDLEGVAATVRVVDLPGEYERDCGFDVSDWLDAGHGLDDLIEATAATPAYEPPKPITLDEIIRYQQQHYYLPDARHCLLVLAAVAANRLPGDPLWLLKVGAPSTGKTESFYQLTDLEDVHFAGTITEAGLLSGTSARETAGNATGGLLVEIGDQGIMCIKDFGSVLEMRWESRATTLAALREIYDGSWVRRLGTDGGKTLAWQGKVGLIAGVTGVIDRAHSVMSQLGERCILYRLPDNDRNEKARSALRMRGQEAEVRRTLGEMVQRFFLSLDLKQPTREITTADEDRLIDLADVVTRARSGVPRESYGKEIADLPETESPPRVVKGLLQLLLGFDAIGVDRETSWPIVEKCGLDCIPNLRRKAIEVLLDADEPMRTKDIADCTKAPTTSIRRALEDLQCHGVTVRDGSGNAHTWKLTDQFATRYPREDRSFSQNYGDHVSGQAPHGASKEGSTLREKSGKRASAGTDNELEQICIQGGTR